MGEQTIRWVKGHGTENDFVLLPDVDGTRHPGLGADTVRALCHRRRGVGADGVLRVVRCAAEPDAAEYVDVAEWFMDFHNADGLIGEMCGNGLRVFGRYLLEAGLVSESVVGSGTTVPVATRGGLKHLTYHADGRIELAMGVVSLPPADGLEITAAGRSWPGIAVDVSNPHAVAFVDDVAEAGPLLDAPTWTPPEVFPAGVNVEFAERVAPWHLRMRVHERGVGETRSCGTGACAVAAAAAHVDGVAAPATYRIDVPGGTLAVDLEPDGGARLTGPAVLTARGEFVG